MEGREKELEVYAEKNKLRIIVKKGEESYKTPKVQRKKVQAFRVEHPASGVNEIRNAFCYDSLYVEDGGGVWAKTNRQPPNPQQPNQKKNQKTQPNKTTKKNTHAKQKRKKKNTQKQLKPNKQKKKPPR